MFSVEEILDSKIDPRTKKPMYLIKWQNYKLQSSSWQPQQHLQIDCKQFLRDFLQKTQNLPETDIGKIYIPKYQIVGSKLNDDEMKQQSSNLSEQPQINQEQSNSDDEIFDSGSTPLVKLTKTTRIRKQQKTANSGINKAKLRIIRPLNRELRSIRNEKRNFTRSQIIQQEGKKQQVGRRKERERVTKNKGTKDNAIDLNFSSRETRALNRENIEENKRTQNENKKLDGDNQEEEMMSPKGVKKFTPIILQMNPPSVSKAGRKNSSAQPQLILQSKPQQMAPGSQQTRKSFQRFRPQPQPESLQYRPLFQANKSQKQSGCLQLSGTNNKRAIDIIGMRRNEDGFEFLIYDYKDQKRIWFDRNYLFDNYTKELCLFYQNSLVFD